MQKEIEFTKVPLINVHVMSDDEWNRLAYKNWLERKCYA